MIIDRLNAFAIDHPLTSTGTTISPNVIDLGPLGGNTPNLIRDIGAGKQLYLHVCATTPLDSAAEGATINVSLISSSTANLTTTPVPHYTTGVVAETAIDTAGGNWLVKGYPIPSGPYQRYVGLQFVIAGEAFTAGVITAWLSDNRMDDRTYRGNWRSGVP